MHDRRGRTIRLCDTVRFQVGDTQATGFITDISDDTVTIQRTDGYRTLSTAHSWRRHSQEIESLSVATNEDSGIRTIEPPNQIGHVTIRRQRSGCRWASFVRPTLCLLISIVSAMVGARSPHRLRVVQPTHRESNRTLGVSKSRLS